MRKASSFSETAKTDADYNTHLFVHRPCVQGHTEALHGILIPGAAALCCLLAFLSIFASSLSVCFVCPVCPMRRLFAR